MRSCDIYKSHRSCFLPAIGYLVYAQFHSDWRLHLRRISTVILIIAGIWGLGALGWNSFWGPKGGGPSVLLEQWTTNSVLTLFSNVIGIFGSPTKGLFVFAPVLLFSIYAIPRAYRRNREATVFGLLVTACMVALISILSVSADEVWGPRFMHVTIAPLLVIIGAANPRFEWRRHFLLLLVGAVGVAVSFLGAFYYYGGRSWAATAAHQNTLEWFAGDSVWNEIRFDAQLFRIWLKGGTDPVLWTPAHVWAWKVPPDAEPWITLNLRDYADPQSFLLYYWKVPLEGSDRMMFRICFLSLIAGPLLLAWVIARTIKLTRGPRINAEPEYITSSRVGQQER